MRICVPGLFTCKSSSSAIALEQYLEATHDARSAILDRSIYEDFYIFSRALHHMGNLAERDYLSYQRLFDLVVNSLPRPDLLIYLKAPVSVLMNRIHKRARNMETGITADYLDFARFLLQRMVDRFRSLSGVDHSNGRFGFRSSAQTFGSSGAKDSR